MQTLPVSVIDWGDLCDLVQLECTDLIMEVDKHVLEAAHCFSLDSNWGVVGNSIQDSSCSW